MLLDDVSINPNTHLVDVKNSYKMANDKRMIVTIILNVNPRVSFLFPFLAQLITQPSVFYRGNREVAIAASYFAPSIVYIFTLLLANVITSSDDRRLTTFSSKSCDR